MSVHLTPLSNEEYHKRGLPVKEQHTSWNWKPANLEDKDEDIPRSPRNSEPEAEAFTSYLELKPTFSPSIVHTPQHYRDSSSRTARQDVKQQERVREYRDREQERAEREPAEQRKQRELREQDLQEREQRVKHERREPRAGIKSRHTVTPHVDPHVNRPTNHSPGYGFSSFPTSGSAEPSTHYTPFRQVQTQTTPPSGLATQHSTYTIWYPRPELPASLPAQVNPADLHVHPPEKAGHKYTIWHPKPEPPASLPNSNSQRTRSPEQVNPRNLRIHPPEDDWSPWYPNPAFAPSPEPED